MLLRICALFAKNLFILTGVLTQVTEKRKNLIRGDSKRLSEKQLYNFVKGAVISDSVKRFIRIYLQAANRIDGIVSLFDLNVENKLCKQLNQTFLRDLGYHLWVVSTISISFNPDQTGKASIKNSTPNRHEDILVIKEQSTAQFLFKILPA